MSDRVSISMDEQGVADVQRERAARREESEDGRAPQARAAQEPGDAGAH